MDGDDAERIAYSTDVAAVICELVGSGLALKEVCLINGMPRRTTAYKWLGQHEEFANMYARAREERADLLADEIVAIADTEEDANKARVRIDARKWWAAKVNPKNYGDKLATESTHTVKFSDEFEKFIRAINRDKDAKIVDGTVAEAGSGVGAISQTVRPRGTERDA